MEKVKHGAGLAGRIKHNTREFITSNIDTERTGQNWISGGSCDDVMQQYKQQLPGKVRKNAVLAVEVMMTASPGFQGDWKQYLDSCDKWAKELFGEKNVLHIAHHMDETTPHTHIVFMPLKDGKLNAKHFIGGSRDRMTELQNDFHQKVGNPLGLERGQPRAETKARHTPPSLTKRAMALDEREKKLNGFAGEFKKLIGLKPQDVRELQKKVERFENLTPAEHRAIAIGKERQPQQQQGRKF